MRLVSLCLATSLVAGCASAPASKAPSSVIETRVGWRTQCGVKTITNNTAYQSVVGAAVVAIVVPKLISGAIDAGADYLKAAGQSKAVSSQARVDGKFYDVTEEGDLKKSDGSRCLEIVRANFGDPTKDTVAEHPWADGITNFAGINNVQFRLSAIAVVVEKQYLKLIPTYFKVEKFQESSWFKKTRDYSIAVTFATPGSAAPFSAFEFKFPGVRAGDEKQIGDMVGMESLPVPLPADMADAKVAQTRQEAQAAPYVLAYDIINSRYRHDHPKTPALPTRPPIYDTSVQAAAQAYCHQLQQHNRSVPRNFALNDERCTYGNEPSRLALEKGLKDAYISDAQVSWANSVCQIPPTRNAEGELEAQKCSTLPTVTGTTGYFITTATLVETREGSKFAAYLGNALAASKDELSTLVQSKVIPAQREAARDAADKAKREGYEGMLQADYAVEYAQAVLIETSAVPDIPASQLSAAKAKLLDSKIKANKAYRDAGRAAPYPHLD